MSCLNRRTHKFSLKEERLKDAVNGMNEMNFRCICCCCRFELALQQNEILDVFYDDYLSLADDETTFGAKSDNYLKVM